MKSSWKSGKIPKAKGKEKNYLLQMERRLF